MNLLNELFPAWALSRSIAKNKLKLMSRYYDAAKSTRYRKLKKDASPQAVTGQGAEKLRAAARNLDENHDLAIGILDTLVNNIVGSGIPIMPIVKNTDGSLNESFNDKITEVFEKWKRFPEVSRTLPFDEMTRIICRSWLRDGEVFTQKLKGTVPGLNHYTKIPYSLEIIESDAIPYELQDNKKGIVQGIQINAWKQPIAFHVLKDNSSTAQYKIIKVADTIAISSEQLFHIKFTRRPNQLRGVSILHGVITRLEDIKNYEESERIAAQVAASMTGFIKKSLDMQLELPNGETAGERELEMSPGMIFDDLLPGEEIGTISSDRPNTGLGDFRNAMLKAAAAGTGTNYSTISKNYDGSYSSQRQSMIEALPGYQKLRNYFIEIFVRPLYEDFLEMAIASNQIKMPHGVNPASLYDVDIRGVLLPWIDPKKEIEADVIAINNGLKARTNVIRERGGDPVKTDKLIEADDFTPAQVAPETTPTDEVENA